MKENIDDILIKLTQTVQRLVDHPVAPVAPVLPLAPINNSMDHDLLTTLCVKVDALKDDIKQLKDGTSDKIKDLENTKLNIKDSYPYLYKKDIDTAIEKLEIQSEKNSTNITRVLTFGSVIIVLISIAQIFVSLWFKG